MKPSRVSSNPPNLWLLNGILASLALASASFASQVKTRIVAPDWSGLKGPYVEESVLVEVAVNRSGTPVFIKTAEPVPDNVIASLEQSSFDISGKAGNSAVLRVVVRRALSGGRERLLMPDWTRLQSAARFREAVNYSEKDVARLEKKGQYLDDKKSVGALLTYYTFSVAPDPAVAKRRRAELISRLIEKEPKSNLLGTTLAIINTQGERLSDPAGFAAVASLWEAAVRDHPGDGAILDHAVRFMATPDPNRALRMIDEAKNWDRRMQWAGRIYAMRSVGAVSVDLANGILNLDAAAADASSKRILLASQSTAEVLSAMWTLHENAPGDSGFCPLLHAHAQELFPATEANCQPKADLQQSSTEPELATKVVPHYPQEARWSRTEGTATFRILVDKTGTVANVEFLGGPLVFYNSARDAVSLWRFTPRTLHGQPIEFSATVEVNYQLMSR